MEKNWRQRNAFLPTFFVLFRFKKNKTVQKKTKCVSKTKGGLSFRIRERKRVWSLEKEEEVEVEKERGLWSSFVVVLPLSSLFSLLSPFFPLRFFFLSPQHRSLLDFPILSSLFLSLPRSLCVTAGLLLSPGAPPVEGEMEGFGFDPLGGDLVADQSAAAAAATAAAGGATAAPTTTASAGGAFDLPPSLQLPPAAPFSGTVSDHARIGC